MSEPSGNGTQRPLRVAALGLSLLLAAACSGQTPGTEATRSSTTTTTTPTAELPEDSLQAIVDELPEALRVPGVVVGVSNARSSWLGAAGIDDVSAVSPMTPTRRFRAASITKLFTITVVMGMVEDGRLSLDDRLSTWFPSFPNAADITVRMLLAHTAGVNTDWWDHEDILDVTLADLGKTWTPAEVIDLIAQRPPAGPPGGASLYSNTGYILLGEIAAAVGGAPIGTLIERTVIEPLRLAHTTYQFDNPPHLAHAYYDFAGETIDTGTMAINPLTSMAGAAGAIHTDAADLLRFFDALFQSDRLLTPQTIRSLQSTGHTSTRWGLGLMAYCPCEGDGAETTYAGWGHTGELPGYFSVAVHYPAPAVSIVVFLNRSANDGQRFDHGFLDPIAERLLRTVVTQTEPTPPDQPRVRETSGHRTPAWPRTMEDYRP